MNKYYYLPRHTVIKSTTEFFKKITLIILFLIKQILISELTLITTVEMICVCVLVTQSWPILCNPVDCTPPGFPVHEILQTRIQEWVSISFSRGSSQPRDRTPVSCTTGRFITRWATRLILIITVETIYGRKFRSHFLSWEKHTHPSFKLMTNWRGLLLIFKITGVWILKAKLTYRKKHVCESFLNTRMCLKYMWVYRKDDLVLPWNFEFK